MNYLKTVLKVMTSSSRESSDYNAFKTRPITLRPEEFFVPESYCDEKRTSINISESDTASLKYAVQCSFLDMKEPQTYEHLEESADRFFRFRLLQKSMRCFPDNEGMAMTGYYLTQHDVMIIRDSEQIEKKLNALKSFPNAVAGEWQNLEGDLLLFPAPEGNKDYSHLKRTLRDIIISMRCIHRIRSGDESKKACQHTTSYLLEKYDKASNIFVNNADGATLSIFKPLFLDINFTVVTKPHEKNKLVLILEFLQKAVLIYIKLADLAIASNCLGNALALCRMQRYCCDHITYILDCDLDNVAYTHIITNWMLANIFVKLYDKLQEGYDLDEDSLYYDATKEELEAMYACIADMRTDLREMAGRSKIIDYPWKFPREEEKLLETADYYFGLISAPLYWKRTTYRKMFVQCKISLLQLVKTIDMFAALARSAHKVDFKEPRDSCLTASHGRYNFHLHDNIIPVDYDRPLAEQKLRDLLISVDGACSSAYVQHTWSTFCNDLKAILSVIVGVIWKLSALSDAANALNTADTNNNSNQELFIPEDSPIPAREAYAYRKMRENFKDSLANVCIEDHADSESLERSHGFRINLLMKNMREEVVLQIEQERRDATYTAGVLGLVECLISVSKVADFENQLPRDSNKKSYRIMAADFLLGLSTVYLVRYEKEKAKPAKNEEAKEKRLKALLHNSRYYHLAFAMYIVEYPYVAKEVCRTYIDHTELVTDFFCRGGTPLAALTQDLLALRRLMPLLPVVWECCILGHWPNGPVGYEKVEMTAIEIPFHKRFIETSFGQLSPRLQSTVELIQMSDESLTLEGDSFYETSGELNDYAKNVVEELSDSIKRIAVDDVKMVDLQMPIETAAEEISKIICTAKGDKNQNDSEYQKAKLAHQLSKCLAKQFAENLLEITRDPTSKDPPSPKRKGGCCTDRKVLSFTSTFAVLCGMLGVYAVDFHWSKLKPGKAMERLSSELVADICDAFYNQCTPPEDRVWDKTNLNKMAAFFRSCTKDYSLSTSQSEKLMASGEVSRIIVSFAKCLKRFSVHGDLQEVPFAAMVKETSRLFAFGEHYTDETWQTHAALIAKCISIGVLRTELKVRSDARGERPLIEPKFEQDEMAEGEIVFENRVQDSKPVIASVAGELPTNIEHYHVEEETAFNRKGGMYADKIFEDVFYCTNFLYKAREFSIEAPLLRLVNFLRADLDRHLKENAHKPPCKLFGTDLTEELLAKLNGLKMLLKLPLGDGAAYIHILKVFHALDKMFFGGTTSSILRGTLHKEFE